MNDVAIQYIINRQKDPFPNVDYQVCHTWDELESYFADCWEGNDFDYPINLTLGEDTESEPINLGRARYSMGGPPYCLTFSRRPGTGRLVYASNHELLHLYGLNIINGLGPLHLFHNYLHDADVYERLRLPPIQHFSDTMVRAYNLCLGGGADDEAGESRAGRGSLSLKILSKRLLNMEMTSFKDTVFPFSVPIAMKFLWEAESTFKPTVYPKNRCECGCTALGHAPRGKTGRVFGKCLKCFQCLKFAARKKPRSTPESQITDRLYLKITNLLEDVELGTNPDLDPWKRMQAWEDHDHQHIEDYCGVIPVPSIAHVPEPQLLRYAVRDADAAIRLHTKLETHHPWIFYDAD